MAQGRPPYAQYSTLKVLFYTATLGAEKLKKTQKFSQDFLDLMDSCFQIDWNLRPSAQELLSVRSLMLCLIFLVCFFTNPMQT
jgi:p21-activated kinase 1